MKIEIDETEQIVTLYKDKQVTLIMPLRVFDDALKKYGIEMLK